MSGQMIKAIENGDVETARELLVNSTSNQNDALILAAGQGYEEIVKLLLKVPEIDPIYNDYSAIKIAISNDHINIVKLLVNDERTRNQTNCKNLKSKLDNNGINFCQLFEVFAQ